MRSMRRAPAILLLAIASCVDMGTEPAEEPNPFSLNLAATKSAGGPAAGLRVSAWNNLPFSPGKPQDGATIGLSATSVEFEIPVVATVGLVLLEQDGRPVSTPVDERLRGPGLYLVRVSFNQHFGTRVYTFRLTARDSLGVSLLFQDSIFAVLWEPDAALSVLGWTDPGGSFRTTDSLLFPNLLALPPLVRTLAYGPDPVGSFSIPDSVIFCLTDTAAGRSEYFGHRIGSGFNELSLRFAGGGSNRAPGAPPSFRASVEIVRLGDSNTAAWRLYQNYPNPFN